MDNVTGTVLSNQTPDLWILTIKTIGGLCLVLAALMGTLYLLKRLTQPRDVNQKGMIRLLSTFYLAPKERLHLMEVLGRKILIGVTAQGGITRIAEFDYPEEDWDEDKNENNEIQPSVFKNLMSRLVHAKNDRTTPGEHE